MSSVSMQADAAVTDDFGAFVPGERARLAPTGTGPLDGLTFAVKDLIDVAGTPTGGGNPDWLRVQRRAAVSAPVVDALLAAGATMVGKTVTDELAFSLEGVNAHYGTPRNPACPDRIPGGSSSGSAVAVAAGLADVALGTDTGGSVRVPASFVGVLGFRPTHGAVSLAGVVPFALSYDTVGWFARDAAVLGAVGDVLLPPAAPAPIRRFRLVRDAFALADAAVAALVRQRCEGLDLAPAPATACPAFDAGPTPARRQDHPPTKGSKARSEPRRAEHAPVDEVVLFDGAEAEWAECYRVLQGAEIWHKLGPWITSARPRFGPAIAPRFADAATITPADVARWAPARAAFAARVDFCLDDETALVLPTAPCVAPPRNDVAFDGANFYRRALALTSIAGHAGLPQLTVPVGRVDGCPVGLSIVAASGRDRALLALAGRWA